MKWVLLMLFAYLLGSVPTGVLVVRLLGGEDPREAGSGNIGATNVARTMGKLAGALTLVGDVLKGFLPSAWAVTSFQSAPAFALVGLAAFLGHLFPVFLHFKGGKGVATGLGVFLSLAAGPVLLAAGIFVAVLSKWRMVSLASISAAASLPLLCGFLGSPAATVVLALAVAAFTVWKHWGNIQRIMAGTEDKIGTPA